MGHTLVAWDEDEDTATLANLAAVVDQSVGTNGDFVRVPPGMDQLGAVYAGGVNISLARMQSPSLRDLVNPDIAPLDQAAEPSSPYPLFDHFSSPIALQAGENLEALAAEDGAGSTRRIIGAWLVDGPAQPVAGDQSTVRCTGTTTLVANAWTAVELTFGQTIPAGRYQVVGARFLSATAIFGRLVVPGAPWRPGAVAQDDEGDLENPIFRNGRLGVWTEFDSVQSLQAEFLATAGDTAETVYLDIVKVG